MLLIFVSAVSCVAKVGHQHIEFSMTAGETQVLLVQVVEIHLFLCMLEAAATVCYITCFSFLCVTSNHCYRT